MLMSGTCPICDGELTRTFEAQVLRRYMVGFYVCRECGYLCSENPWWLSEAYRTPIAISDTGILRRNAAVARRIAALIGWCLDAKGSYLDVGGGHGLLVRHLRDHGIDAWWDDPHTENLFARGFEASNGPAQYAGVTAVEVIEHLRDPLPMLRAAMARCRSPAVLILTTEVFIEPPPAPSLWRYYAFADGQHVGFHCQRSLRALATRLGLRCHSRNGLHVLADPVVRLPLMRLVTGRLNHFAAEMVRCRLGALTLEDSLRMGRNDSDAV